MAGRIPQAFIDDLLDRIDIVEVVDSRVKLKKSGKNYSACCPFHDEKTPSFTVSPDKQFYYCFGCGASGTALGFILEYERLNFPDAVEQLAKLAGLEVPREKRSDASVQREQERKSIYSLLEKASAYYQQQLRQHSQRQMAVNYLKQRGLSGEIARDFAIGFAPPGWDNLLKQLCPADATDNSGDNKRLLIDGGMLVHNNDSNKLYDRFRHRIIFPIHDLRGRVIGFGGRVLGDDKPKYLNSPETPVFHKGQELYGLFEARQAYRELPRLLVVEGYMDVVALAQFGIRYGVATLGTACSGEHLTRAFKYTNEVVFCFDGDAAGRQAARRALENTLPVMQDGRQVKFLFLPDGEDPDTLIRQIGADKFSQMIDMAVPLEDFLFDSVAEKLNIQSMEGRARLCQLASPLIDKLPKGVFRELMLDNLARRTGLDKSTLLEIAQAQTPPADENKPQQTEYKQAEDNHTKQSTPADSRGTADSHSDETHYPPEYTQGYHTQDTYEQPPPADHWQQEPPADYDSSYSRSEHSHPDKLATQETANQRYLMQPERKAIALLLAHPEHAGEITLDPDWIKSEEPDLKRLGQLLQLLQQRPHYNFSQILGAWPVIYSQAGAQALADIAGIDLLNSIKQFQQRLPDETGYDSKTGLLDSIAAIERKKQSNKSAQSLAKIKNADFTQLSREERQQLVLEALAGKPEKGR